MSTTHKIERRVSRDVSLRAERDATGATRIIGYGAVFNSETRLLDSFIEVIKPGAFTRSLAKKGLDVCCLFNHSADSILSRTPDTLTLTEDSRGLKFESTLPATTIGRDLAVNIENGNIRGCSFAFRTIKQRWTEKKNKDGSTTLLRELLQLDIDGGDVSPVTYPAYPATTLALRSLLFPAGVPDGCPGSLRSAIIGRQKDDDDLDNIDDTGADDDTECLCECEGCLDDRCEECDNEECTDERCARDGCPAQDDDRSADSLEAIEMRRRRLEVALEEM